MTTVQHRTQSVMVIVVFILSAIVVPLFGAEATRGGLDHPDAIVYIDLTHLHQCDLSDPSQARLAWDTLHLMASVQGIVNRDRPRLFVRFLEEPDDFWWSYLREEGAWLADRPVCEVQDIESVLKHFESELKGLVVYQEQPWVGSNLASTIAGVEDRAAVRYSLDPRSVYRRVLDTGLMFTEDRFELFDEQGEPLWTGDDSLGTSRTGSQKNDAYLWLKQQYMETGRVSKTYMAYYIDAFWLTNPAKTSLSNNTLTNHDFFISQKALFFDLHVWGDEPPIDDTEQKSGTDLATLRTLMRAMNDHAEGGVIHIGGFTPWAWKYTNRPGAGSTHGPVATEWKLVKEVSAYNGYIDADALGYSGMTNASFYQHFPLQEHYPQHLRPTKASLREMGYLEPDGSVREKVYILAYMGDYDAAAWFYQKIPEMWNDPARGQLVCNWAFSPILDRRAPHVMHYVRSNSSARDWFVTSDNGAGYLNPSMLTAPRQDPTLPDGWDRWVEHNVQAMRRYDLSIVGFLIDGQSPDMGRRGMDAYMRISPDGLVRHQFGEQRGLHRGVMPYVRLTANIGGDPLDAATRIMHEVDEQDTQFLVFRSILRTPTWHLRLSEQIELLDDHDRVEFVDAYTFFELLKLDQKGRGE